MSPAHPASPPTLPALLVAKGWIDPDVLAQAERRAGMGASDTTIVEELIATGAIATDQVAAARRELAHTPVDRVGRHAVEGVLGRGGMGEVLAVRDASLGRVVAAKRLHPGSDLRQRSKFLREARITGALEHPGIVPVHELDTGPDGVPFFTMKRIAGRDLDHAIAERDAGPGSLAELLRVFAKVTDAVGYAHAHGVIHRDLKPANIMVGQFGEVYVCDWGLAKSIGSGERTGEPTDVTAPEDDPLATLDGTVMGTPAYMAPEQADGRVHEVDHRSDIYSLGAILYQILCGVPPYVGGTAFDVLAQVANGPPPPPSQRTALAARIPWELEAACLRAMAREPRARYASALELKRDVESYLTGGVLEAARYTPLQRALKWTWRHRALAFPAIAVLTVLAATGIGARVVRAQRVRAIVLEAQELLAQGRSADAAERYSRALIIAPADPDATQGRDRAAAFAKHDQARALVAKAAALTASTDRPDASAGTARALEHTLEAHLAAAGLLEQACALAPHDREIQSLRCDAGVALARLATDSGDYTVARHAIHDLERHGWTTNQVEEHITRIEQRRNARRDDERQRLEAILADLAPGLRRPERDASAPTLDDYVLEAASIRAPETVATLVKVIAPILDRDARTARTAAEEDVLRFAMRVLGKLRLVEAIPPLDRCARSLQEHHLLIEAGRALCDTRLAEAREPLERLEQRLGAKHKAWLQIAQWIDRLPLPADTSGTNPRALFARGKAQLERGDGKGAIATFEAFLRACPDDPAGLVNRALAYLHTGDHRAALADLDRALEIDAHRATAFHTRAQVREQTGEVALAFADYGRAIELDPDQHVYRLNRANLFQRHGQVDRAFEDYGFVLERWPHFVPALVGRSLCAATRGRMAEARADLDRALALDPNSDAAHECLGELYLNQGDCVQAEQHLLRAIELGATSTRARILLAAARLERGDPAAARAELAYAAAQGAAPSGSLAYLRARVEFGLGDLPLALAAIEEAVRLMPNAPPYHGLHALILTVMQKDELANAACARALALDPADGHALRARGLCHERAGRYAEALDDYTRSIASQPDAQAYLALARCRRALGDLAGALADADRAIERRAMLADAHGLRGALLAKLGRGDDALAALDRALELDETMFDARVLRAQQRQARGLGREALSDLDRAVALDTRHIAARGMRGLLRRDLGDHKGAIEDFQAVLALDPTDWRAHVNLAMTWDLDGRRADAVASMRRALEHAPEARRAELQRELDRLEQK